MKEVYIVFINDSPEKVYFDEVEAELMVKDLKGKLNEDRYYVHIHTVPLVE